MSAWPPDRRPRALLVDLDGTLADSHPILRRCFDELAASRGLTVGDDDFAALDGTPLPGIVAALHHRHGLPAPTEDASAAYLDQVELAYATVSASPGAADVLAAAGDLGLDVIVVTAAPARIARAFLRSTGLEPAVQGLIAGEGRSGKPSPEPYVAALALAGVHATEAVAVEDSRNGVVSARTAGVRVIGVAAAPDRAAELASAGASRVAATMPDVAGLLRALA